VGPIPGDRVALRRILENLVGNAVDSVAGTGGTVEVFTEAGRQDGGAPVVRVTIADSGPGMSRAELDRAFDDFYTTKDGGTGLGLSIVRRLVLDLGGALRVDTRPGEGTRVTGASGAGQSRRMTLVLVVDDVAPLAGSTPTTCAGWAATRC
jgi:signal transduction histidine kinase